MKDDVYYEDQRTAYAMAETYERHNHGITEPYYTRTCPYCRGYGWQSAGPGDTRQYRCPDCGGSGEIAYCSECDNPVDLDLGYCEDCFGKCEICGGIYLLEDLDEDNLCPDCREECAEEDNETTEAVNA